MKSESEVAQSCLTLCNPVDCSLPAPPSMDFPAKSTGMGCHFVLQRIFSTQGSNPVLPHCRQALYHLSHQGSLKIRKERCYCNDRKKIGNNTNYQTVDVISNFAFKGVSEFGYL